MCIIPYATQQGEISFCAYNTGVGWRQIVEKMHLTATLGRWHREHGRHEVFAGGKSVPLSSTEHSLVLDANAVTAEPQKDLATLNIPKTAREERVGASYYRDTPTATLPAPSDDHAKMARLYAEHVLGQKPVIQIEPLRRSAKQ